MSFKKREGISYRRGGGAIREAGASIGKGANRKKRQKAGRRFP